MTPTLYGQWKDLEGMDAVIGHLQGKSNISITTVVGAIVVLQLPFYIRGKGIESRVTGRKWDIYVDKFDKVWFSEL